MKITYVSCDGETEVVEDVTNAEFYEGMNWGTGGCIPMLLCKRFDGDEFEIDCISVCEICEDR